MPSDETATVAVCREQDTVGESRRCPPGVDWSPVEPPSKQTLGKFPDLVVSLRLPMERGVTVLLRQRPPAAFTPGAGERWPQSGNPIPAPLIPGCAALG